MSNALIQDLQKARQLMKGGQYDAALTLYERLATQSPQCGMEYAHAAIYSGDFERAIGAWEEICRRCGPGAGPLLLIANEYALVGLHARSRILFARAAQLEPRNFDAQIKLAWLLSRTNSVAEARPAVEQCLALMPGDPQALYLSAHLDRRENKLDLAEQKLRDLLAGTMATHGRYTCEAELAEILDRTGRYDEAMVRLGKAKELIRREAALKGRNEMNLVQYQAEIDKILAMPADVLQQWAGAFRPEQRTAAPTVAFLTGSARSGTTLLERVLDAHPAVAAFDETQAYQCLRPHIYADAYSIPASQLNLWRSRYVKNLTAHVGTLAEGKTLLLDKNPSRTNFLPGFLRVFPELRVLLALRDPRDVIVSMYFHDHPMNNTETLTELADRYRRVMDVWLAIRKWSGLNWMETRYEDIVADLPGEGRRVTQFLGLDWHEAQERYFEKNREKPILSNNYSSVTQPVYARAVGRWKNYEKHLAPIQPLLEPYCKAFGYA